ncbi:autotransporter outer membrane beta-barrel domain-containing protein [Asticcacaulis sp. AC402]|uniref:autotransporter outer membrane beta-barrel domain-containing protein n=1 Tax=Asticcacaulis sp. AC402 TaxID=1282361 RepID=UPI0003C3D81E|nr:autotransporter outer membrane beta-barrel domain-containing protein [Asticcacaulis sp. AC402]ESQ75909.1 hypothetical protein ABAC402_08060 [Asticcacaulis sp. AC402]
MRHSNSKDVLARLAGDITALCLKTEIANLQGSAKRRDDRAALRMLEAVGGLRRDIAGRGSLNDVDQALSWLERLLEEQIVHLSPQRRQRLLAAGGKAPDSLANLLRPALAAGLIGTVAMPTAAADLVCDTSGAVIVCDAILTPPAGEDGLLKRDTASDASSGRDGALGISAKDGNDADTGNDITITFNGEITVIDAIGIEVVSTGGLGGKGGDGYLGASSGDGGRGGTGGKVLVTNNGVITSQGIGIGAVSQGGDGGTGGGDIVSIGGNGGEGGQGGLGGFVDIVNHGTIQTSGETFSVGIVAQSRGGYGGGGGDSVGFVSTGGEGGRGADAGIVRVTNYGRIETEGQYSSGVLAQSIGGFGGGGGTAYGIAIEGGDGRTAGNANYVTVQNGGAIETHGDHSEGILAQSIGGGGGHGGDAGGLGAAGGYGGAGGIGSVVFVRSTEQIITHGADSTAMKAQSIGGGGGDGGLGTGVAVIGGRGAGGGAGGEVNVDISGTLLTEGEDSAGIWAQSVGGGGGSGGGTISGSLWAGFAVGGSAAKGGDGAGVFVNALTHENSPEGHIVTKGDRAFGIYAQSIGGGGGHGGYAISGTLGLAGSASAAVGGTGGEGGDGGVVLTRYNGSITTSGDDATGILAQSVGGGGGTGGYALSLAASADGAVAAAVGGTGGGGGDGKALGVYTWADITTSGDRAYGVMAQSIGGGGGDGGASATAAAGLTVGALGVSLGGTGGGGGDAGRVDVFSHGTISTGGYQAHALSAQSLGGGGGNGGVSATFAGGGFNAAAVTLGGSGDEGGLGGFVAIENDAALHTVGGEAHGLFAQSVGGGGGSGGMAVAGEITLGSAGASVALGGSGGGGLDAGAVEVKNSGAIHTEGDGALGLYAQSVGGGGGSGGMAISGALQGLGGGVSVAMGREGGTGGNGSTVTVTSSGNVTTQGHNAGGLQVQSIGGGGGAGGVSVSAATGAVASAAVSLGGSGAGGGTGGNVRADISGDYATAGDLSHALTAQSIGGGGGSGGFAASGAGSLEAGSAALSMGGSGGDGGSAGAVNLNYDGHAVTEGFNAFGILAQSVGGGGGSGGFTAAVSASHGSGTAALSMGGEGGEGGSAAIVVAEQKGSIHTTGDQSIGILAQSVGGGGGNGGFASSAATSQLVSVAVSVGGRGGEGGTAGAVYATANGTILTEGDRAAGVVSQSIGGGGGNGGFAAAGTLAASGVPNQLALSLGGNGDTGGASSDAYLNNYGQILTRGEDSEGVVAQSIGGGGGRGGFSYSGVVSGAHALNTALSMGGFGGIGGQSGYVNVLNTGSIGTEGARSLGIFAQSVGGGGGAGGASGAMTLSSSNSINTTLNVGGKGGTGGLGGDVEVTNTGLIETIGEDGAAILAQSIGGGGGRGGMAGVSLGQFLEWQGGVSSANGFGTNTYNVSLSLGGFGGSGEHGGAVTVLNSGSAVTRGENAPVIYVQSIGGGGGHAGLSAAVAGAIGASRNGAMAVSVGGNGGTSGDGGAVTVTNEATIHAYGAGSGGIFMQSIGGGGGNGGNAKGMATALGYFKGTDADSLHGLTVSIGGQAGSAGDGGEVKATNSGTITTEGAQAFGIYAESVGGGGGNGGNITGSGGEVQSVLKTAVQLTDGGKGDTFSIAIGGLGGSIGDGGAVTVTNSGTVQTLGDGSHAIFAHSIGGGGGNGGAGSPGRISIGGQGASSGDGGVVTVTNSGSILTQGAIARGIFAQSVGGGGGTGGATSFSDDSFSSDDSLRETVVNSFGQVTGGGAGLLSLIKSFKKPEYGIGIGGFGGAGGDGGAVIVSNTGTIGTSGTLSHAIFAQSVGGGGGTGGEGTIGKLGHTVASGPGGSGGDGGDVSVTNAGDIMTTGFGAMGIFAQSVGGGGGVAGDTSLGITGLANVPGVGDYRDYGGLALNPVSGDGGDGGNVTVSNTGNITTLGAGAVGIFAESIGGGGGLYGSAAGLAFAGSLGGSGDSGTVTVVQNGNVYAGGLNALGAFFQSDTVHDRGDITATINGDLHGGSAFGAGILVDGGQDNTLNLNGWTNADSGMALRSTVGNDTFNLSEGMEGNADLGTGRNAINSGVAAAVVSGDFLRLGGAGSGTLTSQGLLAPGDVGHVQHTAIDGDFVQTASGRYHVDMAGSDGDRLDISGTAKVDGHVVVHSDPSALTPGRHEITVVHADGGLTSTADLSAPNAALVSYGLTATANDLKVGYDLDFARLGTFASRNRTSVGHSINAIQTAGGSDALDPLVGTLLAQTDAGQVAGIYDALSPTPLVANLHGLVQGADSFQDGMMSCALGGRRSADETCVWARAHGREALLHDGADGPGFDSRASGVQLGFEAPLGNRLRIGMAVGAENIRTESGALARGEGDQYHIGVTAKTQALGLDLAMSAQTGFANLETERATFGGVVRGEPSARYDQLAVRASHTFRAGSLYLRPALEAARTRIHTEASRETGVTGIAVSESSQDRDRYTVSVEAGADLSLGRVRIHPYVRVGQTRYSDNGDLVVTGHLAGAPAGGDGFDTYQSTGKSAVSVNAGVSVESDDPYGLRGRVSYEHYENKDFRSDGVAIKLVKPF